MSSVIFSSAQRIISQVLQWLQISNQTPAINLVTDVFNAGIDNSTPLGDGFFIIPGTNNTSVNPTVNCVGGGIAYDPTGARIFLDFTDTSLYNPANVTITTNDGLGNFILTPQSTGVVNIPVTQSSTNYVWVNYLATIDTTAFTLNSETNAKIFYKQTDGYNIQVTTINVPPNANSIFLASVNMTGGGAVAPSNISLVGRTYFNINPKMVPITTPFNDGSNRTPSYNQNTTYTLDAHIKSIGTGTGITPFNPHNMSLADLGVGVFDTVQEHRILEHGNAIIAGVPGTPYPSTSAMAQSINIVNPGSDSLNIFALTSTEFAIINGSAFNANDIFGNVPTNATVLFPPLSGTYNVYWSSVAKEFDVTTSDISTINSYLWIATVTYAYVGAGPSDHNSLSGLIDRRRVGSTTHLLQRWTTNSRPGDGSLQPQSGEFGFNLISNHLEYWDGTTWQQPVNASSNSLVPTGVLLPFAGLSAPSGFLLANGGSYSTAFYPALFSVIGYTYGGSGGSFNVPDMRGNVPAGTSGPLGLALGGFAGALNWNETHSHPMPHQHIETVGHAPGSGFIDNTSPYGTSPVNHTFYGITVSGQPTQNLNYDLTSDTQTANTSGTLITGSTVQPTLGVNFIIKY